MKKVLHYAGLRPLKKSWKKYNSNEPCFFVALRTNFATENEDFSAFTLEKELSTPSVNSFFAQIF